jgi:hypothetical protein
MESTMDENRTRIQIDLAPTELERMNTVMRMTELKTRKDLFNNALSLFEWAAVMAADGREIGSVDSEAKIHTIVMPALKNAAAYGRRPGAENVRQAVEKSLTEDTGANIFRTDPGSTR